MGMLMFGVMWAHFVVSGEQMTKRQFNLAYDGICEDIKKENELRDHSSTALYNLHMETPSQTRRNCQDHDFILELEEGTRIHFAHTTHTHTHTHAHTHKHTNTQTPRGQPTCIQIAAHAGYCRHRPTARGGAQRG